MLDPTKPEVLINEILDKRKAHYNNEKYGPFLVVYPLSMAAYMENDYYAKTCSCNQLTVRGRILDITDIIGCVQSSKIDKLLLIDLSEITDVYSKCVVYPPSC